MPSLAQSVRGRFTNRNYVFTSNWSRINTIPESIKEDPDLTELGRVMASLPVDPQQSRLLLFGLALKCFNPIVTLVAALSHREPCKFCYGFFKILTFF